MASYELKSHNYQDIVNDVTTRFYPRDLIMDEPQIQNCFDQALSRLDDYCFYPRYYQLPIKGNMYADTNDIVIDGIVVKKVIKVYSTHQTDTIFTMYSQLIGQTPFYYNVTRNQDTFIEFMLTSQVNNMINKRFRNKDTGFMFNPKTGHVLLDSTAYNLDTTVLLEFYPSFAKVKDSQKWELFSVEYNFLVNYMEGLVMYREGRAMSETSFTGLETNASDYMTKGEEIMVKVLGEFRGGGLMRSGKRF